ncbi:MAG: CoA transferase, partial [Henriciella sp.]|uniref:CoA transferase n=1 Tax=Henriciella sp. TaxID=1968823 RepID=UPI003C70A30C
IKAREAIIRMVHPVVGEVPMQGVFPKLSQTPGKAARPAPSLGEHTSEILAALGRNENQIADLKARGII